MRANDQVKPASSAYRNYVLGVLLVVYLLSAVDRQILGVLIEPIKKDLLLSDTQIGLLSGLAFGLLYATMALPLSRIADRWSRQSLISICVVVWSIATGFCGLSQNFLQLFAARVVVGTGEAGASPSSHSLIADYFPPERRATAFGIYSIGITAGAGLGLAVGGYLASVFGWRGAFVAVALPGLVVALIAKLTIREPVRGAVEGVDAADVPPFGQSIAVFWKNRPLVAASFGLGFSIFCFQAILNWLPAFLSRSHGMSPLETGAKMGPTVAIFGTAGVVIGGIVADRVSRGSPRRTFHIMALASLLVFPAGLVVLFAADQPTLFAALGVAIFLMTSISGPTFAMVQNLSPIRLRAFSSAMLGVIAIVLGNAFGPFVAGALSDLLSGNGVAEPLRWSLVICISAALASAIFYLVAASKMPTIDPLNRGKLEAL